MSRARYLHFLYLRYDGSLFVRSGAKVSTVGQESRNVAQTNRLLLAPRVNDFSRIFFFDRVVGEL